MKAQRFVVNPAYDVLDRTAGARGITKVYIWAAGLSDPACATEHRSSLPCGRASQLNTAGIVLDDARFEPLARVSRWRSTFVVGYGGII